MVGTRIGNRRSLLIEDAAVLLGVSRRTVYYRIREGRLDTVRTLGGSQRVLLASIERMLRQERGLAPLEPFSGELDCGL
jgi:excisionase family DNA binding protein